MPGSDAPEIRLSEVYRATAISASEAAGFLTTKYYRKIKSKVKPDGSWGVQLQLHSGKTINLPAENSRKISSRINKYVSQLELERAARINASAGQEAVPLPPKQG